MKPTKKTLEYYDWDEITHFITEKYGVSKYNDFCSWWDDNTTTEGREYADVCLNHLKVKKGDEWVKPILKEMKESFGDLAEEYITIYYDY